MYENVLEPLSSPYNQREESLHLEPILQVIATLTRDHCSPWEKFNLFVPKIELIDMLKCKLFSHI